MTDAADALRGAVVFTLFFAAAVKLYRPQTVAHSLASAGLPIGEQGRLVAILVSLAEVAVGATLLLATTRWHALPAAALLVGFAVYLVVLRRRAPGVGCACFGSAEDTGLVASWLRLLVLGMALAAAAAFSSPDGLRWTTLGAGAEGAALLLVATEAVPVLARFRARFAS